MGMMMVMMLFAVMVYAQNIKVTGTVTDSSGEPIVGASVVVVGAKGGTVTDLDGKYSLLVSPQATLRITYLGFKNEEVKVGNRKVIDVEMKSADTELNEVVVVGYGTQKKVNVTGAVSMVGAEVLEDRPVTNVTQALQGAVPGLNFSANSNGGMLNNSMAITIRGTGSIGNGSTDSPLILIDGI